MKPKRQFRYGLKFSKMAPLHFISHLDLMRFFERILRRAELPLVYSEGFNPHPKIALAQPLAVGIESEAEYLEFYLNYSLSPDFIIKKISCFLPESITIKNCFVISNSLASLTALTEQLVFEIWLDNIDKESINKKIEEFLSGKKEVKLSLIRKGALKEFVLNPFDYFFEVLSEKPLRIVLKIKYYEGVPMHALEIAKAVLGIFPQKVIRKEIILKYFCK